MSDEDSFFLIFGIICEIYQKVASVQVSVLPVIRFC